MKHKSLEYIILLYKRISNKGGRVGRVKKSCVLLRHVHIRKRLKDDVAERLPLVQDE